MARTVRDKLHGVNIPLQRAGGIVEDDGPATRRAVPAVASGFKHVLEFERRAFRPELEFGLARVIEQEAHGEAFAARQGLGEQVQERAAIVNGAMPGLFVITPKMGPGFFETLPVGKFHGIGPATTAKMNSLGIHTGADLRECELPFLVKTFGKAGRFYYWIARGIDERPVRADRVRKSIGAETTLLEDLTDFEAMRGALIEVAAKVWRHCQAVQQRSKQSVRTWRLSPRIAIG